jgi:hypothetical protein
MAASSHLVPLPRVLNVSSRLPLVIEAVWSKRILLLNVHTLTFSHTDYQHGLLTFVPHLRILRLRECVGFLAAAASPDLPLLFSPQDAFDLLCYLETIAFDALAIGKEWIQTYVLRALTRSRSIKGIATAVLMWSSFESQDAILDFLLKTPSLSDLCMVVYLPNSDASERGLVIVFNDPSSCTFTLSSHRLGCLHFFNEAGDHRTCRLKTHSCCLRYSPTNKAAWPMRAHPTTAPTKVSTLSSL